MGKEAVKRLQAPVNAAVNAQPAITLKDAVELLAM